MIKNVIIGVLLIAAAFFKIQGCNTQKDLDKLTGEYQLKDSAFIAEAQEAKRWKTENGLNILRVNSLAVTKGALEAYNQDLKKELKAAKIKLSQITKQTEVTTKTEGSVTPKTDTVWSVRDSITGVRSDSLVNFKFVDKFLTLKGEIKPRFYIQYEIRDSLRLMWTFERDGFLRPKKLLLTAYSSNPNTKITGIKDFEIREKPKRFFVGIGGSFGYNGNKFVPTVGIIGGLKILRL